MKQFLNKLIKGLAYFAAAMVIVLAIAVGIFRLMLPRLPEYQEEIKAWASNAIGMSVEFTGMNARWRLSGPELSFFGAGLSHAATGQSIISAEEVSIGVGLFRLVADRELVVDRVTIRDSAVDIRQDSSGRWSAQGIPFDELIGQREMPADAVTDIEVVATNIRVDYEHPASGQLVPVTLRSITVTVDDDDLGVEADIELPEEFGERLEITADTRLDNSMPTAWQLYVEADSLDIAGWSRLQQFSLPEVSTGQADFMLWMEIADGRIDSASANVAIENLDTITPETVPPFGLQGNFEYSATEDSWLLGANQLRVMTVDGDWPQSALQVRVQTEEEQVDALRIMASYFNVNDLRYFRPWMPADWQSKLAELDPGGVMRDLEIEVSDLEDEIPRFHVVADLEAAGYASTDSLPGVRDFSGRIRADRDGGRVEIESTNLSLDLTNVLSGPLVLDDAFGTVIWRRNLDGVTVLSDSVQIRNADFDSQISLQVSLPSDGGSPVVDFESTWAVIDVSAVDRYLPARLMSPKLYDWLNNALVSGYVRRGTTRFVGALDRFPFDDGDGIFRIEARIEDAVLQYAPAWPAPRFRHLDIVVDRTRLYSEENSSINLGNFVEDAKIEIADLRAPILTIDAFATGTLQSILDYASQSPIANVFGGQLDKVSVGGDASFDLSINLPIQQAQDYEFMTRIRTSDGMVRVAGFAPPITELNGTVMITRQDLSSESLFGKFLGYPIDLSLTRLEDPDAPHTAILTGRGSTTAADLQAELDIPLEGLLSGDTEYRAEVRFPNARSEQPGPLQVVIESDLYGMQANLPAPVGKSDEVPFPLRMNIEFPTPEQITTAGSLAGEINWTGRFLRQDDAWDFDRGVIAIGEYPRDADVRGLHIHGQLTELHLHEWLAESRRGNRGTGLGERVRSIDLTVDRFFAVGQMFTSHRMQVNRSGQDWVLQIDGAEAEGMITIPYEFASGRPMVLDMRRLYLPGDDAAENGRETAPVDPRSLPALSVRADEFALGERRFGRLEADFDRADRGLRSSRLETESETFRVSGEAGWVVDAYESTGQRTYVDAILSSTNVEQTAARLQYDPGIESESMEVRLNIGWPGGPRHDFLDVLDGQVGVSVGEGRLADVDPGAGRVFGLMSVAALPRRLSLDFSDVFDEGFGFDAITGDFRIAEGNAYTCNLTLTGPAADVGIVGRAGLVNRDYDQAAIVSANVGNTLPVVGLLAGGPQVAAALLVFSQLFKKPLQDMGQVFYTVEGSWDEPGVDNADSQRFALVSNRAGCIEQ